jgi:hypothetical protein
VRARVGWYVEDESDLEANLVFASNAKLARPQSLARLRDQQFEYVVIGTSKRSRSAGAERPTSACQASAASLDHCHQQQPERATPSHQGCLRPRRWRGVFSSAHTAVVA